MDKFDAFNALSRRRWNKELRRRQKKAIFRVSQSSASPAKRPYKSAILDLFMARAAGPLSLKKAGPKTFVSPVNFSLSANPAECISYLSSIVAYVRETRRPRIILDQRRIRSLGLGADSVLGILLSEVRQELATTPGAYIKGFKPKAKDIQRIMDEVGSVRALFMEVEEDIRLSFRSRAKVFRHRHRPSDQGLGSRHFDPVSATIAEFADHLSESLSFIGRKLSVAGLDSICHYVGEVINNVEEHAGIQEWAIVGFTDPDAGTPTYSCVIFCFGKTIAETFLELPRDSYPWRLIDPYVRAHKGGSLFSSDWREEDLLTLIALQGDVSSKSVDDSSDRGQGTVELIEFFQGVTTECGLRRLNAEMNIVSGSTRIRFDGTYGMAFREDLNRHIIAFNMGNDLTARPDRSAVMSLNEAHFPGTLITVRMPLMASFLEPLEVENED